MQLDDRKTIDSSTSWEYWLVLGKFRMKLGVTLFTSVTITICFGISLLSKSPECLHKFLQKSGKIEGVQVYYLNNGEHVFSWRMLLKTVLEKNRVPPLI